MFSINRSERNPFISPNKNRPWEAAATFNWSPVKVGKNTHAVYRASSDLQKLGKQHGHVSIIAQATSTDGKEFKDNTPFITPEKDFEKYGCEDPRVTKVGNKFYIFYTALSKYPFVAEGIKVAVAISKDMKTIDEKHLVTPFNAKAMAMFPEKINGKFTAILSVDTDRPEQGPAKMGIIQFDKEEEIWSEKHWQNWYENIDAHTINLRRQESDQVEVGAAPIKTKDGWLLIYSHIRNYTSDQPIFGVEAVLLDLENPQAIIGRTNGPFMVPETFYEKTGLVPNIVFPSGALVEGDTLEIYYGGADTHCAKATTSLSRLLGAIQPTKKPLVQRYEKNPIITPRKNKDWEAGGTFNPAAIDLDGKAHILYRAVTPQNVSTVGYATAADGLKIDHRANKPIFEARVDFEGVGRTENAGTEDARIIEIDDRLYLIYTAYDGHTPRVAVSSISTEDFLKKKWKNWSEPEIITDPGIPNKDAIILPEKINGMYYLFHRVEPSICADLFPSLDFSAHKVRKCIEVAAPRPGMWDGEKIGMAGPAIKTKKGWLAFYHGVSENTEYRVGALLLDLKNPVIVLGRSALPLFEPEADYELEGVVPNVVFPCGTIVRGDTIYMYYGGGDFTVGVATMKLSEVLKTLTNEK